MMVKTIITRSKFENQTLKIKRRQNLLLFVVKAPGYLHVICLLTSLPSYSPSHTGSRTQPADPPSGCTSGRPFLRLHGNRGRTGAARPSSGGTSSAAHNHSVSTGHQQQVTVILYLKTHI